MKAESQVKAASAIEPAAKQLCDESGFTCAAETTQAAFWNRFWGQPGSGFLLQQNPLELLVDMLPLLCEERPERLLDIGCGEGRNLPALAGLDSVFELTALDQSVNALARIRESGRGQTRGVPVKLVQGDCSTLPLRSGSIDFVLASDLFNHLPSFSQVLEECARILRPGGLLICNPLSFNDPAFAICTVTGRRESPSLFSMHPHSGGRVSYIMHFAHRAELESLLSRDFDLILPLEEKTRRDPPHASPFRQQIHEHAYWQVVCRRR